MAEFPSLPLFVDAYMLDAGHLSDAEHGRYLLLLMTMWAAPGCRLPNDDQWLARRFRRSIEAVQNELHPIIREFCERDGNWITQKRLRKEWLWCDKNRRRQSVSAKARWDKEKKSNLAMPPTPPHPKTEDASASSVASARKKGTRLPDTWQPAEADLAFARTQLRPDRVQIEIDKFRDHWLQSNQTNAVKRNWSAAWRNWCRRAVEYGQRGQPVPETQRKPTIMEAVDNLFERINGPKPRTADPPALRLVPDGRGK